jgi:hypothetical protein
MTSRTYICCWQPQAAIGSRIQRAARLARAVTATPEASLAATGKRLPVLLYRRPITHV